MAAKLPPPKKVPTRTLCLIRDPVGQVDRRRPRVVPVTTAAADSQLRIEHAPSASSDNAVQQLEPALPVAVVAHDHEACSYTGANDDQSPHDDVVMMQPFRSRITYGV